MKKNKLLQIILNIIFIIALTNNSYTQIDKNQYKKHKKTHLIRKKESRIRHIKRQIDKVYDVSLQVDYVAHIEFDDDDEILNYSVGKKDFFNIQTHQNILIVTPLVKNLQTNIIITTKKKRKYTFNISSHGINENNPNIIFRLKIHS